MFLRLILFTAPLFSYSVENTLDNTQKFMTVGQIKKNSEVQGQRHKYYPLGLYVVKVHRRRNRGYVVQLPPFHFAMDYMIISWFGV
jgi:hypothetical protein